METSPPREPGPAAHLAGVQVRPERLAAAARVLQPVLLERLALAADRISDGLARQHAIVQWERIHLLGLAQRRLMGLREERFGPPGGAPVRILERATQPLESIDLAWRHLRQGRPVHVEAEAGSSDEVLHFLRDMGELLGDGVLSVSEAGARPNEVEAWERVGVAAARERVGLVQADADREVAAYVLARACLRRSGFDPRAVHRVLVVGPSERFERDLRRLFVGARMGDRHDDQVFAGSVGPQAAMAYLESHETWAGPQAERSLCVGSTLLPPRGPREDDRVCLAPALVKADYEATRTLPPPVGPLLVLHPVDEADAERVLEDLAPAPVGRVRVGEPPRDLELRPDDRLVRGALLVERLPPGLPEPRP